MLETSDSLGHNLRNAAVEWIWDDLIGSRVFYERSDCLGCREFHLIGDFALAGGESTAEYPWERQDVIDLVRVVGSPCCHDAYPRSLGIFRENLWCGVRERENDRIARHGPDHVRRESSCHAHSNEAIRSLKRVCECAGEFAWVGGFRDAALLWIEILAIERDNAATIARDNIGYAV